MKYVLAHISASDCAALGLTPRRAATGASGRTVALVLQEPEGTLQVDGSRTLSVLASVYVDSTRTRAEPPTVRVGQLRYDLTRATVHAAGDDAAPSATEERIALNTPENHRDGRSKRGDQ